MERRKRRGSASNSASAGPDRLEVQHVEELALEDHLEDLCRRRRSVGVGDAHVVEGRRPARGGAVPSPTPPSPPSRARRRQRLVVAVVVEQAAQVARQLVRPVVGDLGRAGAAAVAPQVRRDGAVAGVGQRAELVAPGVPQLGEAVAEDDGRPVGRPGHGNMQLDPVGRDLLVGELRQGVLLPRPAPTSRPSPPGASGWPTSRHCLPRR